MKEIYVPQAVGASTRVFELMDRSPKVPSEGGQVFITLQAGKWFLHRLKYYCT